MNKIWEYPTNPKHWPDSTIYIIGGGYSVSTYDYMSKINSEKKKDPSIKVLGINMAYTLKPTKRTQLCDAVIIGDNKFYKDQRLGLREFKGLKFMCGNMLMGGNHQPIPVDGGYLRLRKTNQSFTMQKGRIGWDGSTGIAALNLCCQLGASRIVLVGYDMNIQNPQQTNWHKNNVHEKITGKRVRPTYYEKVKTRIEDIVEPQLSKLSIGN